jgi:acyl-CoA reductase-like NAD-dependent aldehyde dehydrogenase
MSTSWRNRSPGDLSIELPEVTSGDVYAAVDRAKGAFGDWRRLRLRERADHLKSAQSAIAQHKDDLARSITLETGKPLRESIGEIGAVIAKFDLTIADAERWLATETPADNPHPAQVRKIARGPAAVIGPFNFPIHLAHGAIVAHLIAGNTVVFKPSPLAANVAAKYAAIMSAVLPDGVFNLVQGGGEEGRALCVHPDVRAVCFTGSVPVGQSLAKELAGDLSKDLALELGGKNAAVICPDADLDLAAIACAEGACLTAGQRCNATSRLIVDRVVFQAFLPQFLEAMEDFMPADPLDVNTRLGPLISAAAVDRYRRLTSDGSVDWLIHGEVTGQAGGKRGYYVRPAVARVASDGESPLLRDEAFAPIVTITEAGDEAQAVALANDTRYGLSASIFTRSRDTFNHFADALEVGNVYANLATTFSPSTLPFGGLRNSGNGRPGGRGFVRFVAQEQAVQIAKDSLE